MKNFYLTLFLSICLGANTFAQKDTVWVETTITKDVSHYDYNRNWIDSIKVDSIGTLNSTIDSVREAGSISDVVFMLYPNERYVIDSTIVVQQDEVMEIAAPKAGDSQETAPPQIIWLGENCEYVPGDGTVCEREIDQSIIIHSFGDLILKNIWVYYADIEGNQLYTSIIFEDDSTGSSLNPDKEYGHFDGVIFDYSGIGAESGGAVTIKTDKFVGIFKNCYFRNGTDPHFKYYGRAVSFPFQSAGYHIDSLLFENTTFSNLSRIVMMEGGEYVSNLHLNHVTLINSIEWPIQSGWWEDLSITNSIFVNTNLYGYRPAALCSDNQSYEDFKAGLCDPPGGGLVQDVVPVDSLDFEVDYTDEERQLYIGNNVYYYEEYMLNWYDYANNREFQTTDEWIYYRFPAPPIGKNAIAIYDSVDQNGNKVYPLMNVKEFYKDSIDFMVKPVNYGDYEFDGGGDEGLLEFLYCKMFSGCDARWAYKPEASFEQQWPLPENLAYSNEFYLNAAMNGFPLGDLNWFPEQKAAWEAQRDEEWANINSWLEQGAPVSNEHVKNEHPEGFKLDQNYPNPFNPSTVISYQLPVSSMVSLKVYDMLGREVATLVDRRKASGVHKVRFDASNIASGIYLYRLQTGDGNITLTKKLTLIK